jgi:hypothetical protein
VPDRHGRVCPRIATSGKGTVVSACYTSWHQLSTTYTAKANGDQISFVVSNAKLAANSWFLVDLASLTAPN